MQLTDVVAAVGGIYSVIKSKAPVTTAEYGERYTLIGPLNHQSVSRRDVCALLFAC
jgi:glycogen(starch) synthase